MGSSYELENAVLLKTPQEAAASCLRLSEGENSCRALGLACRFRGLGYVKALVESGANFNYTRHEMHSGYFTIYYWLAPLNINYAVRRAFFVNGDKCFSKKLELADTRRNAVRTLTPLPMAQRVEIVKYLCKNSERVLLDPGELLFYSIMSNSKEITAALKERGAAFSEKRVSALTEGGRGFEWQEFCNMSDGLEDSEYIEVTRNILAELDGKKLYYTELVFWGNYNPHQQRFRLYKPEVFKFVLDNFNQKKMNKTQIMKGAIDQNSAECLKICEENGWLKMPRKRDEMIRYAADNDKTECTAFLLDFKNRTADLAAERAKAEKKAERELNADPNSAAELKKIWACEKQDDGTLIITRYKGKRTEAEVPAKIGKSAVTAIGAFSFSAIASRVTIEQKDIRRSISAIKLPESIRSIGDSAFADCWELSELNIPAGVSEIGEGAFGGCRKLTELTIPDGVKRIAAKMFPGCLALGSVKLPENIAEIGDMAFTNCSALREITIPNGVERIGKWAFRRCQTLTEITIPEGVSEIGALAFADCPALKTVVLPASLKKINNYKYRDFPPQTIFHNSVNVTAVVAPKSYAEQYCKRNKIPYKYAEDI